MGIENGVRRVLVREMFAKIGRTFTEMTRRCLIITLLLLQSAVQNGFSLRKHRQCSMEATQLRLGFSSKI